ncbi:MULTISPECIES: sensor histidine kinase [unclassified Moraxella]|uniref:sensor histidine kinase n=1 Tax=unclassified Moraxella TaxID=2685852 RepID=UPI003AF55EEF
MITNPAFSSLFDDRHIADKTQQVGNVYNGYRILISTFLSMNFLLAMRGTSQSLWTLINVLPTVGYFLLSLLLFLGYFFYPKNTLLMIGLVVDVLILSFSLYFSGGTDLQTILLFLVTVAASFMLVRTHQAILITAFAITLVIYQQFNPLQKEVTYSMISNGGLMVLSFIGVAYLSHTIAKRLLLVERLSLRQTREVNALNAINDKIVQVLDQGVLIITHQLEILLASNIAIQQLNLPTPLSSYFLPLIAPNLAEQMIDFCTQNEQSLVVRLSNPEQTNDKSKLDSLVYNEFRLRVSQLGNGHALILIEDLRREQAHAQQLKLASLGQLSASIAHEIRNPLAAISQASEMLLEESQSSDTHLSEDDQVLFEMIFKQTKRVNQIIEDVLNLSRQQKPNQTIINPCSWIPEFIKENFSSHDVFFHCSTQFTFNFDPYQLEQVLVNLVNNGLRFCSKVHPHAYVTIEVYDTDKYIYIDVIDTGAGVTQGDEDSLFNPFFTTDHEGTGLGLYLSQAFCQANHANLLYIPNHEHTCFRIACDKKLG